MSDTISRQAAIDALNGEINITGRANAEAVRGYVRLVKDRLERLPSAQPKERTEERAETHACDLIDRQVAIDAVNNLTYPSSLVDVKRILVDLPSAQPEQLTDKEQRIFLAAMGREEKVCKEVDEECSREPYEDSLVRICHEITRKVKGALWNGK